MADERPSASDDIDEVARPSATLDLTGAGPDALTHVRRWLSIELVGLGQDHLTDVLLVAVELATNAYEHGDGALTIRNSRSRDRCSVRIEVDDSNTNRLTLGVSRFGESAHRGRGLLLVDRIGQNWGVRIDATAGRKTVWAQVACEERPCPAAGPGHLTRVHTSERLEDAPLLEPVHD